MIQLFFLLAFAVAETGAIKVQLEGLQEKRGRSVLCALYRNANGFPMRPNLALEIQRAENSPQGWSCEFLNLKPARYAVSVLHDKNGDGKMNTNAFGIPQEGWATSNNVFPGMRPPTFKESSVEFDGHGKTLKLQMHY